MAQPVLGTKDKPVVLDMSQLIRRVAWAGGGIAILSLDAEIAFSVGPGVPDPGWDVTVTDANFEAIRGESLLGEVGRVLQPPGPPSANFKANNEVYCYPPRKTNTEETETTNYHFVDRGLYVIYTNAGVINSHVNALGGTEVPFVQDFTGNTTPQPPYIVFTGSALDPGGTLDIFMTNVASQIFSPTPDIIFPLLSQEISGHNDVVTRTNKTKTWKTQTFLNIPLIVAENEPVAETNKIQLTVVLAGVSDRTFIRFVLALGTYKGVKELAVDDNELNMIRIVGEGERIAYTEETDDRPAEQVAPSVEVKFTIDLETLQITATRRDL